LRLLMPHASTPECRRAALRTRGYALYVNLSFAVSALIVKSSASTLTATVPAACFGVTKVHLVVLVQVAEYKVDPISTASAPAIGRKPEPFTVTVVPPAVVPDVGEMLVTFAVVSFVAYWRHMAAVRPG